MAPLTAAEKNRRKRERKKQQKEERRRQEKLEEEAKKNETVTTTNTEVEVEYVAESLQPETAEEEAMSEILERFQERGGNIIQDISQEESEDKTRVVSDEENLSGDESSSAPKLSNRKLKQITRPSVSELKSRVKRPDLVEAHDVCAPDPDFLIYLKAIPGSVPVPRHWGRKRKYLQGKRGIEKPPFHLPEFIFKTGITEIRSAVAEDEAKQSAKQKNRSRVAPKMGGIDVDYRVLHDAFFKYQTKPPMTKVGDLYYEGKEFEVQKLKEVQPGVISEKLRQALGMTDFAPPPWLTNMQRYGPPPSYPNLKIPGLNAPIPVGCTYGFHMNGWGKPPVDEFGRPLYGGDPFGKPTPIAMENIDNDATLVTSDGKHLAASGWGSLPTAAFEEESEDEEEDNEMDESDSSSEEEEEITEKKAPSKLPLTMDEPRIHPTSAVDLRKTGGMETPAQLYKVLDQKKTQGKDGEIFSSDHKYVVPSGGAASVLSKQVSDSGNDKKNLNVDDDHEVESLAKKFKF